jgi:hypothetical protein
VRFYLLHAWTVPKARLLDLFRATEEEIQHLADVQVFQEKVLQAFANRGASNRVELRGRSGLSAV